MNDDRKALRELCSAVRDMAADLKGNVKGCERLSDALIQADALLSAAPVGTEGPGLTISHVIAWFRQQPGISWLATIRDIETACTALAGATVHRDQTEALAKPASRPDVEASFAERVLAILDEYEQAAKKEPANKRFQYGWDAAVDAMAGRIRDIIARYPAPAKKETT